MYVDKIDKVTFGGVKKLNFQLHCCGCSNQDIYSMFTKEYGVIVCIYFDDMLMFGMNLKDVCKTKKVSYLRI